MRLANEHEMSLAVCILFYERLDQTIECVKSFLPSEVNLYILNNGSSAKARKKLGEFCKNYKRIKIFDSDTNLGVGVGRNYLITHTNQKWLFFVDSDIMVKTTNWLQKFSQHLSSHKESETFVAKVFDAYDKRHKPFRSIRIQGNKAIFDKTHGDYTINVFPGGASIVNRQVFNRLGLYDKKMFVGFEDFELCLRGILMEKPVKAQPMQDVELIHNHPKAKTSEDKKATLLRYELGLLDNSFKRIVEKHNVVVSASWERWARRQVNNIVNDQGSGIVWKQRISDSIYLLKKPIQWFLKR